MWPNRPLLALGSAGYCLFFMLVPLLVMLIIGFRTPLQQLAPLDVQDRSGGEGGAGISRPDDLQHPDTLPPNPGTASTDAGPRFSQVAILGAAWAPLFFALLPMSAAPSFARVISMFTLLPLGLLAPFGTTTLGVIALGQIRRSSGRLYGLGLALFDALVFPLLASVSRRLRCSASSSRVMRRCSC